MNCRFWKARFPVGCIALLLATGCHEFPDIFIDELPESELVTTMSARRARSIDTDYEPRVRDFADQRIEPQDGNVAHGPLWFEDPFEMAGSDDGRHAATVEDMIYFLPCGPGRFLVNLVFLPVSVLVDLPGKVMCSDGRERRSADTGQPQHYDPEKCIGAAPPADIDDTWTFDEQFEETPTDSDQPK